MTTWKEGLVTFSDSTAVKGEVEEHTRSSNGVAVGVLVVDKTLGVAFTMDDEGGGGGGGGRVGYGGDSTA